MDFDSLQEIASSIRKNKLRTVLTAFGVFWGIFMLILLLGVGQGLSNGANKNFGNDDRSSIWISGRKTAIPYQGMPHDRKINFNEADIDAIKQQIDNIQYISAENRAGERWRRTIGVSYKNKTGNFSVYGVADDFFKIKKYLDYPSGRTLNRLDNKELRKIALIGTRVRDRLFGEDVDPSGKHINFHGIVLQVVGVFYDDGWNGRMSERVYIPLTTFQRVFGKGSNIGQIAITPMPGTDPFIFEEKVIQLLKQRHTISPDDVKAILSHNLAERAQSMNQLFSAINIFIWFVGLGTLTAGIVGISNIMIITVKDRTREIGVRKALGATPNSIIFMILLEAILITSVAGYCGLVLGVGLLEAIHLLMIQNGGESSYFSRPEVDLNTALYAMLMLISAGALAGLAPAFRASRIQPIEAMREE